MVYYVQRPETDEQEERMAQDPKSKELSDLFGKLRGHYASAADRHPEKKEAFTALATRVDSVLKIDGDFVGEKKTKAFGEYAFQMRQAEKFVDKPGIGPEFAPAINLLTQITQKLTM
jgi:hypothetical protein